MRNLRITLALAVVAIAAIPGSAAQAATSVCNEARNGHTGAYVATDGDQGPAARHQSNLAVLGSGKGLVNAASHSPALSVCEIPSPPSSDSSGDGVDTSGGNVYLT